MTGVKAPRQAGIQLVLCSHRTKQQCISSGIRLLGVHTRQNSSASRLPLGCLVFTPHKTAVYLVCRWAAWYSHQTKQQCISSAIGLLGVHTTQNSSVSRLPLGCLVFTPDKTAVYLVCRWTAWCSHQKKQQCISSAVGLLGVHTTQNSSVSRLPLGYLVFTPDKTAVHLLCRWAAWCSHETKQQRISHFI